MDTSVASLRKKKDNLCLFTFAVCYAATEKAVLASPNCLRFANRINRMKFQ